MCPLLMWFGLVSLFNELFNAKANFVEEQLWYYLNYRWWDKGIHTFPKGISLKVNAIMLLEFELAYYNVTAQHVSHYTRGNTLLQQV